MSAVVLAIEPPESRIPAVPSGRPSASRSQPSTTSSSVAVPDPPPHDDAIACMPVASQSPSTAAYDDGPGTRAK